MRVRLRKTALCLFAAAVLAVATLAHSATAASAPQGKKLLNDLATKANREGVLNANVRPGLGPVIPSLVSAFKKRFGLEIQVNLDALTTENEFFTKMRAARQAGAPLPLDAIEGTDYQNLDEINAGFATRIHNWELLLSEINALVGSGKIKPEAVSPGPFQGHSFIWSNVTKSLLYNPKLISKADLPRTRADLANPKYKGKLATAPWEEEFLYGVLLYPKEEWLKIVDGIGKNAVAVLYFSASVERILLGQLAAAPVNSYGYWQAKGKDARAPIEIHWFADYTPLSSVLYMVPKGSRHPAAATLFSLWMTTPEAEAILQRDVPYANVAFGQSEVSQRERTAVRESGSRVVTWYDSAKTLEVLKWFSTKEGHEYRERLVKALTQRR